jgi:hypothetical protein
MDEAMISVSCRCGRLRFATLVTSLVSPHGDVPDRREAYREWPIVVP